MKIIENTNGTKSLLKDDDNLIENTTHFNNPA